MKARTPTKSSLQEIKDEYNRLLQEAVKKEHSNAIELCIVTRVQADVDSGLAESTVTKTTKRWKSYIDSVHSGNVTLQEIKDNLKTENGITFDWMGD